MERTVVLIKPDAVQRGLIGEVVKRFEQRGLKIIGFKMMRLDDVLLREHYAHVADKPFFAELSQFMSSSPVVAMAIEGVNAVEHVRTIAGITPQDLGSIRGDFSVSSQRNVVHTSDSIETAEREIVRFFKTSELFTYEKDEWKHVFAESDRDK